MSKLKERRVVFFTVVIVGLVLMLFYNKLSKDKEDEFTQFIQKVDYVCVVKYPLSYVLTNEQLIEFKTMLTKNYKIGEYRRGKFSEEDSPLVFIVRRKEKRFLIMYIEERKELYFPALCFIKNNRKKVGEKINNTNDLLLSVNDDIVEFLDGIKFKIE